MPQKEGCARTFEATSIKGAGVPGVPKPTALRRSPRLLSLLGDRGGATTATPCRRSPRLLSFGGHGGAGPAGGVGATPCRRFSRILSLVECSSGAGPAGGVAATPRRRSSRLLSWVECSSGSGPAGGVAATSCRKSSRLLSHGGDRSGIAGPPNSKRSVGSSARSRRQSPKISGMRRSLGLSKSVVDLGGAPYADATGGGDLEGDRMRSARLRGSIGKGLTGEIGNRNGSGETGRNLRKETKKDVPAIPTKRDAKGPRRADVESAISEESGVDINVVKWKNKREISVVSATKGGRDKKRKQSITTQEELDPQRRDVESGSGCPGWTGEQEIALHRSYILAKPSPHFWKKVAKLVPGKSAQECFNRMHSMIETPVPIQPRSRAKTTDCSPLGLSYLLKKGTRRPKSSKRKSLLLAHKTVRHILRKHSVMDQGQEADLFAVLETSPNLNADLSQIKVHLIPGYITESPELLQRSSENLSFSHKKAHSRFKSRVPADFASPEVLKPVKNIVVHEKYIDVLHCREARRRMCDKAACSVGSEDDKENVILKDDVVKAAKNALVSKARGIICQLGHTQSSPSSNSEGTYGSEDECEEDM